MKTIPAKDFPAYAKKARRGRSRYPVAPRSERTVEGYVFRSRLEAVAYTKLLLEQRGAIALGERYLIVVEPTILLAGVRCRPDFLVAMSGAIGMLVDLIEVKPKFSGRGSREGLRRFKRDAAQIYVLSGMRVQLWEGPPPWNVSVWPPVVPQEES
jgi:hypothetical protein